jgi:serine/threonine protein kinase
LKDKVFVHGDLNPDNILIDKDMNIYIIDFADSVQAPCEYELAALLCETFELEYPYMKGFFGADYDVSDLTDKIFQALLMHDFGENIIKNNFGNPEMITGLSDLHKRIYSAISSKYMS